MTNLAIKNACFDFSQAVAPYVDISDDIQYQQTLDLIESLLEDAQDNTNDPLNSIIGLLADAVETYEMQDLEVGTFVERCRTQGDELSVLRLLMDQHKLGTADLPEIGSKSMVSRVLSGQRNLNKNHIQALSQRFEIPPGLFFGTY